jgi:histone H3/H4
MTILGNLYNLMEEILFQEPNKFPLVYAGKRTTEKTFRTNNLMSIMGRVLPPYPRSMINQEAVDAMDPCVAKFVAMVTKEAAKQRNKEKRAILSVGDLIKAMEKLGYDHYVGLLTQYLRRYRESKGEMGPQPPYDFMSGSSQVLDAAAVAGEMPTTPPRPSDFTLGLPMVGDPAPATAVAFVQPLYDFMAQGPAPTTLAVSATGEMPPAPPHPSDFTLGLQMYDGQTPLARGELGLNTGMLALWSGAEAAPSTSSMPPAGDDE